MDELIARTDEHPADFGLDDTFHPDVKDILSKVGSAKLDMFIRGRLTGVYLSRCWRRTLRSGRRSAS